MPYHANLLQGFRTDNRRQIEAACDRLGMTYEWESDGSLTTHLSKSAFAVDAITSDRIYFNHILTQIVSRDWLGEANYETYLDLYDRAGRTRPYHVTYGDGSQIAESDHQLVADGLAAVTQVPGWQRSDMLLIDNVYTGHGRAPFTGTRDVQVVLID